jgi:hypothetical protein
MEDFGMKFGDIKLKEDRDSVLAFSDTIEQKRSRRHSALAAMPQDPML